MVAMDSRVELIKQGSEARVYRSFFHGKPCVVKERFAKKYRHPDLDKELTKERIKNEVRSLVRCRFAGVHAPTIYHVDSIQNRIVMEEMVGCVTAKEYINQRKEQSLDELATAVGREIGKLHAQNIIHGDLTTSNILIRSENPLKLTFIDFGLSYIEAATEDKGVDLYVLERALISTHPNTEEMFNLMLSSYKKACPQTAKEVIKKFEEIRLRGRKRLMIG